MIKIFKFILDLFIGFFLCILLYNIWDIYHFFSFLLQDEGQTFVTQDIYCAS